MTAEFEEYDKLDREEEKVYDKLTKIIEKHIPKKEQIKVYKLINEYVEVNIEMEKYCNE